MEGKEGQQTAIYDGSAFSVMAPNQPLGRRVGLLLPLRCFAVCRVEKTAHFSLSLTYVMELFKDSSSLEAVKQNSEGMLIDQ